MSIEDKIAAYIRDGKLHEYIPANTDPDFVPQRRLLMTNSAYFWCPPSGKSSESKLKEEALAALRTLLHYYVGGGDMEDDADWKCLAPQLENVWEFRTSVPPKRKSRLFGWVVDSTTFVATHGKLRQDLRGGEEWDKAISKVIQTRKKLGL